MPLKLFLLFIFLSMPLLLAGQQRQAITLMDSIYSFAEVPPSFPGGEMGLSKYLIKNVRLTERALDEGRFSVHVQFVIDTFGCTNDIKLVDTTRSTYALEEEVIRAVKMMPAWKPGRQQGKKVKVLFYLPMCVMPQE